MNLISGMIGCEEPVEAPAETSGALVAPDIAPTISEMAEFLAQFPQAEMPVDHEFKPGVYLRTIHMPAGTYVIGHCHTGEHWNIVSKGRAIVTMDGERVEVVAPCKFVSGAGVQKVLYIIEDMDWTTVHDNPDDCQDIPTLEGRIVTLPPALDGKISGMTLDDFRMLPTRLANTIEV